MPNQPLYISQKYRYNASTDNVAGVITLSNADRTIWLDGVEYTYTDYQNIIPSEQSLVAIGTLNHRSTNPKTVYAPIMSGADNILATDGLAGLVPAPTVSDADKFLRGDGQWAAVGASSLVWDEYL